MHQGKLLLARLNVSKWYARTFDAKATREVATNHGADIGRYNKRLLPRSCESYDAVAAAERKARELFNKLTLPYDAFEVRLAPTKAYADIRAGLIEAEADFTAAVAGFMREYRSDDTRQSIRERARAEQNGLFNLADYPPADEVEKTFSMRVHFLPFPDAQAYGIDLPADEQGAIRLSVEAALADARERASEELRDRIVGSTTRLAEALTRAAAGQGKLYDCHFEAVAEALQWLPKLNVFDDPKIAAAVKCAQQLAGLDPMAVRRSPGTKSRAAQQVTEIARSVADTFAIDLSTLVGSEGSQCDLLAELV